MIETKPKLELTGQDGMHFSFWERPKQRHWKLAEQRIRLIVLCLKQRLEIMTICWQCV